MLEENKKLVLTAYFPVRWRDLDDFGHVNSSVFFTYFEEARVKWWKQLNLDLKSRKTGPVVLTSECTFLKQLFYPADLQVKVYVGAPGRSSFMMYYDLEIEADPEVLYAQGSTKIVWVNYQAGKSLPLPEDVKSIFNSLLPQVGESGR